MNNIIPYLKGKIFEHKKNIDFIDGYLTSYLDEDLITKREYKDLMDSYRNDLT